MTSVGTDDYILGRSPQEYDRLRAQARIWEAATGRLLDQVELAEGARCLDLGCGPGETMRLLAQRVGPAGHVLGVDVDDTLGAQAQDGLHAAGHRQCRFERVDVETSDWLAGAPFDLVFARLLLFHVGDPVAVLRRAWDWVAPGGRLLVQDYDLRPIAVRPALDSVEEFTRVTLGAFTAAGRDIHIGHRLPLLFAEAGVGTPDGVDVAGRLEPLAAGAPMLAGVHRSIQPAAVALGLTTPERGERWLDELAADAAAHGDHQLLWPLLIGAWKRKSL
jgi:SAM-dependent methyltransferase